MSDKPYPEDVYPGCPCHACDSVSPTMIEEVDTETLVKLLSLVGVTVTQTQVWNWSTEQRWEVATWAGSLYLFQQGDISMVIPPEPGILVSHLELTELPGGQLIMAHRPWLCADDKYCSVHRPSPHHMREWPQRWLTGTMFRVCPHGMGHPDPDHEAYVSRIAGQVTVYLHECDGCCNRPLEAT